MNTHHYNRQAANAGGGTTEIPFREFVAPNLQVGETLATVLLAGFRATASAVKAVNAWRWERKTRIELASLDDRTLADIGVARSEIRALAREAAENPTFTATRRSWWTA